MSSCELRKFDVRFNLFDMKSGINQLLQVHEFKKYPCCTMFEGFDSSSI